MARADLIGRWDPPRLGAALLDLVVPQDCAGCARPGTSWCSTCSSAVAGTVRRLDGPLPGAAAAEHAGPAGRAVVAYKDRGQRPLARPLGRLLAEAVGCALAELDRGDRPGHRTIGTAEPIWLVPVPSRSEARRRRGADHMAVLAARTARELRSAGWTAHRCRLLEHVTASQDQVGLGRAQRRANLIGAMRADRPPPGVLVVVDDVTTTGATLQEAVRALRAAGAAPPRPAPMPTRWPILVATITVATRP